MYGKMTYIFFDYILNFNFYHIFSILLIFLIKINYKTGSFWFLRRSKRNSCLQRSYVHQYFFVLDRLVLFRSIDYLDNLITQTSLISSLRGWSELVLILITFNFIIEDVFIG